MVRVVYAACLLACGCSVPAYAADYYVNNATGSDAAAGSASAPWRHAPGDTTATGAVATLTLKPGDTVHFAPGVSYRGTIGVKGSGTAGAPIRFVGNDWPGHTGQAIMDGGTLLGAGTPCASAAACDNAPGWKYMVSLAVPSGAKWTDWLVGGPQLLGIGQYPAQADAISYDDIDKYIAVSVTKLAQMKAGVISFVGQAPSAGSSIALWTQPNELLFPTTTVSGTTLHYSTAGFIPYTDRSTLYSVVNDPKRISKGEFAVIGSRAYLWPVTKGAAMSIGARRAGFVVKNVHDITIQGFSFVGFSSDASTSSGIPVQASGATVQNLVIADNHFGPLALLNGQGFVNLTGVGAVTVTGNVFDGNIFGSGIRAGDARGPIVVRCNNFAHLGRTGVAFINVFEGSVQRNSFDGLNGIHGNAISSYLDNRIIDISDNVVTASVRPITLQGDGNGALYFPDTTAPATAIKGNVLQAATYKNTAVISWGDNLKNLTVTGNTVIGTGFVSRVQATDTGISVTGNTQTTSLSAVAAKQAENAAACTVH